MSLLPVLATRMQSWITTHCPVINVTVSYLNLATTAVRHQSHSRNRRSSGRRVLGGISFASAAGRTAPPRGGATGRRVAGARRRGSRRLRVAATTAASFGSRRRWLRCAGSRMGCRHWAVLPITTNSGDKQAYYFIIRSWNNRCELFPREARRHKTSTISVYQRLTTCN